MFDLLFLYIPSPNFHILAPEVQELPVLTADRGRKPGPKRVGPRQSYTHTYVDGQPWDTRIPKYKNVPGQ